MKPLLNLTFCPTGFNDEDVSRSMSKKIVKLGGFYSRDLTRQANVLVIGKTKQTNKYRFTVRHRHDVVIIDFQTIDTLYERWLAGDDITLSNGLKAGASSAERVLSVLRSRYSAPPLADFYVFIGRIASYPVDQLEQMCQAMKCYKCNSSHFVKDCKGRHEQKTVVFVSDTLQGARVQAAIEQEIPVVHYKWILDCQRRNATLEYDPYYLLSEIPEDTPFEKIGRKSCECWDDLINPPLFLQDTATVNPSANLFQKFKSQGDKIWQSAMSKSEPPPLLSSTSVRLPPPEANPNEELHEDTIFKGSTFHIAEQFPESHSNILRRVIAQNGGVLRPDSEYLIVPSSVPLDAIQDTGNDGQTLITEFFVERCLHYKTLISPPDSWSKPFLRTTDVRITPFPTLLHDNTQPLQVAITGFHGVELLHLNKMLKTMEPMGIKFVEYLNKKTDLLLINLPSLPSIPHDHPLWKNQYCDLFTTQLEYDKNISNQVLRNSLKRKIQFVKQEHSIPVVTPALLIDLFSHTSNLKTKKSTVFLNNISWCIICPRGAKESFTIELTSAPDELTKDKITEKTSKPPGKRPYVASPGQAQKKANISIRESDREAQKQAFHT